MKEHKDLLYVPSCCGRSLERLNAFLAADSQITVRLNNHAVICESAAKKNTFKLICYQKLFTQFIRRSRSYFRHFFLSIRQFGDRYKQYRHNEYGKYGGAQHTAQYCPADR
jgi:hypothetical protein